MNISVEQYSTVINGLRTQLELQRAMTDTKVQEAAALTHWLRESRRETQAEAEAHRDNIGSMAKVANELRDALEYCRAVAAGGSTIQFIGKDWVFGLAATAVQELRDAFTTLEAKHDALLKKRGRARK